MQERIHLLQDELVSELRLFKGLFGTSSREHAQWARACLPPEAADHYIAAWREGRRKAWQYLRRMAQRLREASGDEWHDRLHHVELVTGVEFRDVQPTTQRAVL